MFAGLRKRGGVDPPGAVSASPMPVARALGICPMSYACSGEVLIGPADASCSTAPAASTTTAAGRSLRVRIAATLTSADPGDEFSAVTIATRLTRCVHESDAGKTLDRRLLTPEFSQKATADGGRCRGG